MSATASNLISLYVIVVPILESTVGSITNAYIVFTLLMDYLKKRKMSTIDKILIALSLSNIFFACACSVNLIWTFIYEDFYTHCIILAFTMYAIVSSSWLTACLCVFYFIKIKTFSSGLLVRIKMKISTIIPWFLLFSEVISLGFTFLTRLPSVLIQRPLFNTSFVYSANTTSSASGMNFSFMSIVFFSVCIPFITMIGTTMSTVRSLYLHSRRMEKNVGTSNNLVAHRSAVWMMTHLLLLYIILYGTMFVWVFNVSDQANVWYWLCIILQFSYTPVQSVLLILGSPKLKESLLQTCHCLVSRNT
ncbi:hypothetical protein GDO86_017772 [Hymenochirus boettgeri]|uniref:Taste receptor type 2 n=1 Tax=Hymenochirus boettgeri TaxID=247094 RepID=A0A8T2IRB5_9PIPI|nr:hypothetical protein GDO86_017772 [Hymenochirus boettgeri]